MNSYNSYFLNVMLFSEGFEGCEEPEHPGEGVGSLREQFNEGFEGCEEPDHSCNGVGSLRELFNEGFEGCKEPEHSCGDVGSLRELFNEGCVGCEEPEYSCEGEWALRELLLAGRSRSSDLHRLGERTLPEQCRDPTAPACAKAKAHLIALFYNKNNISFYSFN